MIDWIEKLPDSMTGALVACGLWFGFNYAVLADRAMALDGNVAVAGQCMSRLAELQAKLRLPQIGLGKAFGVPELDALQNQYLTELLPTPLTPEEQQQRCACALRNAGMKRRFDYAVHTASFRLIAPETAGLYAEDTLQTVLSGICGAIPTWNER